MLGICIKYVLLVVRIHSVNHSVFASSCYSTFPIYYTARVVYYVVKKCARDRFIAIMPRNTMLQGLPIEVYIEGKPTVNIGR